MLKLTKVLSLALACACFVSKAIAFEPVSDVSLSASWRGESFSTTTYYKDSNVPPTPSQIGDLIGWDKTKLTDLNFWRLGAQLRMGMPYGCIDDCDGDLWWLSQLYLRGHFYYGWAGTSGKYSKNMTIVNPVDSTHHKDRSKIHKGRSLDGNIALGFLYPVCDEWGIGPVVGWSYQQTRVSMKDVISDGENDPIQNGFTFKNTFAGPFIGLDFFYYLCEYNVSFAAGYEFHWARWNASKTLKGEDGRVCRPFSDRRHDNDGNGHRVYLDTRYTWCECWDVGLGLEYDYFYTKGGKLTPKNGSFEEIGCFPNEKHRVHRAALHAYSVKLDVGYRF
jgi:hypothetical protein